MRTLSPWLVPAALLVSCGPTHRHSATPTPGEDAGASGDGAAPTRLPPFVGGPTSSDEAAAQLIQAEADPGEGLIVLHCSFSDGWASAVPLDVADETGDSIVQGVVALGSFQEVMNRIPNRGRLMPYAAKACSPDLVLHLAPGAYQLVVGRRDRLRAPLAEDAAWMDTVDVAEGDRLEFYLGGEDVTLDVPCVE